MGVAAIWDVIRAGFDERIPFGHFVELWLKEHRRPVRIAIDAYQWLFEAKAGITPAIENSAIPGSLASKAVQLFMSRTRLLLSLNVSFVYIFDGKFKPRFKRKLGSPQDEAFLHDKDFEAYYDDISRRLRRERYNSSDSLEVKAVKQMLDAWDITYCEAPADGEAECARLQREGIVDYVLSNDTDSLAYGATRVLRNFSKHEADLPSSAVKEGTQRKEYMVTPVSMEKIERETGFNEDRLTFLSIVIGADYNNGVSGLGVKRASQLAKMPTYMEIHSSTFSYGDLEDFATSLSQIYKSDITDKKRKYHQLQARVADLVKRSSKEIFGRNEKSLSLSGWAPDFVVRMYFKPLICPKLFEWTLCTNNASTKGIFPTNINLLYDILRQNLPANVKDLSVHFATTMTEAYLYRHILENSRDKWNDSDILKFQKVRFRDTRDPHCTEEVVSFRYWIFPQFKLNVPGWYIDPDVLTKGWLTTISINLLPLELANDIRLKQLGKDANSPTKRSPAKRSPTKKRLPASTQKYSQDFLSPEKLSPKKHTSSFGVLGAPRPKAPDFSAARGPNKKKLASESHGGPTANAKSRPSTTAMLMPIGLPSLGSFTPALIPQTNSADSLSSASLPLNPQLVIPRQQKGFPMLYRSFSNETPCPSDIITESNSLAPCPDLEDQLSQSRALSNPPVAIDTSASTKPSLHSSFLNKDFILDNSRTTDLQSGPVVPPTTQVFDDQVLMTSNMYSFGTNQSLGTSLKKKNHNEKGKSGRPVVLNNERIHKTQLHRSPRKHLGNVTLKRSTSALTDSDSASILRLADMTQRAVEYTAMVTPSCSKTPANPDRWTVTDLDPELKRSIKNSPIRLRCDNDSQLDPTSLLSAKKKLVIADPIPLSYVNKGSGVYGRTTKEVIEGLERDIICLSSDLESNGNSREVISILTDDGDHVMMSDTPLEPQKEKERVRPMKLKNGVENEPKSYKSSPIKRLLVDFDFTDDFDDVAQQLLRSSPAKEVIRDIDFSEEMSE